MAISSRFKTDTVIREIVLKKEMKKFNYRRKDAAGIKLTSLMIAVAMLFTGAANAQQANTVEISDGRVFINGQPVAESSFPKTLDTSGMDATFWFSGDSKPVIEVKGRFYIVADNTLREATSEELDGPGVNVFLTSGDVHRAAISDAYGRELVALKEKARALNEYSAAPAVDNSEVAKLLADAQESANQVVVMASQLPRVDMQEYWRVVKDQNNELYTQFNHEWAMEVQAREMAARARSLGETEERAALINELRSTLEKIFVLKQENRNREIVQLQVQLEGLEKNMRDRTHYKDQIIERRLKDLLGQE
ncbi:MAG: hypothetical protein HKN43_11410 [Rhodothermales bacterium]|nr:hypothetical protein [Rhodothermales bacterium]